MKLQEIENIAADIYHKSIRLLVNLQTIQGVEDEARSDAMLLDFLGYINGVRLVFYRLGFRREYRQVVDRIRGLYWHNHPEQLERITYQCLILDRIPLK